MVNRRAKGAEEGKEGQGEGGGVGGRNGMYMVCGFHQPGNRGSPTPSGGGRGGRLGGGEGQGMTNKKE